ncbi:MULTISPECIES: ester cyclase [Parachlamydia]|jgi:hypothetical protein|uniref:ester cyclase n=1 Tax=Parachlamydia TaxID=83551 RepID=UPI0001C1743C|nr:ester cyclase [Parachlamydia acanthamoebae]EFB40874.1 hypothetical protein pah_c180o065 [Parachlamydia acanthamoebae str. Hall's coccus]
MEHVQKAIGFLNAMEEGRWFDVFEMLDDDFKFYGSLPDPFDKGETVAFQQVIHQAFPDLSFKVKKIEEKNKKIFIDLGVTGTHTGPLKLPFPGFKTYPPSGARFSLPIEEAELIFRNDKVEIIRCTTHLHGGIFGILEQIGAENTE